MPEAIPYQPRWHTDPRTCSHSNDDVCPTCDFDSYYALTYPKCPWATTLPEIILATDHAYDGSGR